MTNSKDVAAAVERLKDIIIGWRVMPEDCAAINAILAALTAERDRADRAEAVISRIQHVSFGGAYDYQKRLHSGEFVQWGHTPGSIVGDRTGQVFDTIYDIPEAKND